jgi:adenylate cyclase
MGIEIERKFLVTGHGWKKNRTGVRYCQGYICPGSGRTVRVRVAGKKGVLTVKGPGEGICRAEFEYEIPWQDARQMLDQLCDKPLIIKERYRVEHQGLIWEIDEFLGENKGLVVAEVELANPDQSIVLPEWIDREVTGDPRYFNASLVNNPYSAWRH